MHQIIAKSIKIYLEKFDQSLISAGEKLEVHSSLTYGWGLLIRVHSLDSSSGSHLPHVSHFHQKQELMTSWGKVDDLDFTLNNCLRNHLLYLAKIQV